MRIIHSPNELLRPGGKVCLAIGFFDGVHLGHQQIIRQTVADAQRHEATGVVITFDQHPNAVVAPPRTPPLIYLLSQKLRTIELLGVDSIWLVHFDKNFSQTPGEEFVRQLTQGFGKVQSICVGANFVFGHKRSGNVELLRKLGLALSFAVHGVAAVSLDGTAVSSTRIRAAIQSGELDRAGQMLGRPYSLTAKIVSGDNLGITLGFPTANLDVEGLALPPHGVYAAHAILENRQSRRALVNIGLRPTIQSAEPRLRVEAHLLEFSGDLYGQMLELVFVAKLREERKFGSLPELQEQISRDVKEAQSHF